MEALRLPSGRLRAVQPVDVLEFVNWESLRSYVSFYAQQTNQITWLSIVSQYRALT